MLSYLVVKIKFTFRVFLYGNISVHHIVVLVCSDSVSVYRSALLLLQAFVEVCVCLCVCACLFALVFFPNIPRKAIVFVNIECHISQTASSIIISGTKPTYANTHVRHILQQKITNTNCARERVYCAHFNNRMRTAVAFLADDIHIYSNRARCSA